MNLIDKINFLKENYPEKWSETYNEFINDKDILRQYGSDPKRYQKEVNYRTVKSLEKYIV